MGKSKSGGTRSLLRGRVGSDVYSIGRDAKGKRQQVVRSLAEQVSNPRTAAQMQGRAIMSTVMQAVSAMAYIVDHSFTGLKAGQPSISEFITQNYKLIKADVLANPISGNQFGIVEYGAKGAKQGAYVISDGNGADLIGYVFNAAAKTITIALDDTPTPAAIRAALGIGVNDFFTLCCLKSNGAFLYERARVYADMAADQEITSENVESVFVFEGNNDAVASLDGNNIVITYADADACSAIIVSRKQENGFKYNRAILAAPANPQYPYSVAIATYPEGARRFLQGGNSEMVNTVPGGSEPAEPDAPTPQLSALTYGGTNVLASSGVETYGASKKFVGTVSNLPTSGTLSLYVGSTNVGSITQESFEITPASSVDGRITMKLDNEVIQTLGEIEAGIPGA